MSVFPKFNLLFLSVKLSIFSCAWVNQTKQSKNWESMNNCHEHDTKNYLIISQDQDSNLRLSEVFPLIVNQTI